MGQIPFVLLFSRRPPILIKRVLSAGLKGPVTRLSSGDPLSSKGNPHPFVEVHRVRCSKSESAGPNDVRVGPMIQAIDPATQLEIRTFPR
jgi:hypothetical protein